MKSLPLFFCSMLALVGMVLTQSCGDDRDLDAYINAKMMQLKALEEKAPMNGDDTFNQTLNSSKKLSPESKKSLIDDEQAFDDAMQPFLSVLPYYCNPFKYPAHIIHAAKACKPFLNRIYANGTIPWTALFGQLDREEYGGTRAFDRELTHGYRRKEHRNRFKSEHHSSSRKYSDYAHDDY